MKKQPNKSVWILKRRLPFNDPRGSWYPDSNFPIFTNEESAKSLARVLTEQKNYFKYRATEYREVEKES